MSVACQEDCIKLGQLSSLPSTELESIVGELNAYEVKSIPTVKGLLGRAGREERAGVERASKEMMGSCHVWES